MKTNVYWKWDTIKLQCGFPNSQQSLKEGVFSFPRKGALYAFIGAAILTKLKAYKSSHTKGMKLCPTSIWWNRKLSKLVHWSRSQRLRLLLYLITFYPRSFTEQHYIYPGTSNRHTIFLAVWNMFVPLRKEVNLGTCKDTRLYCFNVSSSEMGSLAADQKWSGTVCNQPK